jgi:phage-related holin
MDDALRLFAPLPEVFRKLFATFLPSKALTAFFAVVLEYLFPLQVLRDAAIAAGVLIILDTATGFWASVVTKKQITSAKLSRVLTKMFGYGAVVVVFAVLGHSVPGLDGTQTFSVTLVLVFVTLTEGISILENVGRMGLKVPRFLRDQLREQLGHLAARDSQSEPEGKPNAPENL